MNRFADPALLEPLLVSTLTLLHHQATRDHTHPVCLYAAHKLALNLRRLANHPEWSTPMAAVLARLSTLWCERAHAAGAAVHTGSPLPPSGDHECSQALASV
ncbi:MAG: hypothetical protein P3W97_001405 [Tepidimonas sp.]|uniref:hypothetical protein n=1 Tax=Tepidimonas sp. TaxID=2002775 RepID=UPI00259DA62C|nr:hypothetical protein [Tepidimonas sp.]MDM7455938.1 hypothetical protein [Tepidimonas sp.]